MTKPLLGDPSKGPSECHSLGPFRVLGEDGPTGRSERAARKVTFASNGLILRGPYVIDGRKGDIETPLTSLECGAPLFLLTFAGMGATLARGFFPELVGLIPECR